MALALKKSGAKFSKLLTKEGLWKTFFCKEITRIFETSLENVWKKLRSSKEDFEKGCRIFETSLEIS